MYEAVSAASDRSSVMGNAGAAMIYLLVLHRPCKEGVVKFLNGANRSDGERMCGKDPRGGRFLLPKMQIL